MSRFEGQMGFRPASRWRHAQPSLLTTLVVVGVVIVAVGGTGGARIRSGDHAPPDGRPAWRVHLQAVDAALSAHDIDRAAKEWRLAYGAAVGTRRWEPMASVGDAALKIDAESIAEGRPVPFRAEARRAYLNALWTARGVKSREGIEHIAAAFAALGDTEMAIRVGDIVQER